VSDHKFWVGCALLLLAGGVATASAQERAAKDEKEHAIELYGGGGLEFGGGGGGTTLDELRAMGLAVFSTPIKKEDGLGDGPFDPTEFEDPNGNDGIVFGHRPTLQGNGQVLRVNGLDAQSCNECHTIVSNNTVPPTLGLGGVGGMVQNAIIMPSMIDVGDTYDDRVTWQPGHTPNLLMDFDGKAEFNDRFANPPFLFGGGGVGLLGKEMTWDLQQLLALARVSPPGTVTQLITHGVDFGTITTVDAAGNVELDLQGIGPRDLTGKAAEDVLIVRPFGRKGEAFTMRDFDRGAMQFHFGMQPVEVVGPGFDEDRDGISDEVSIDEMTVLHIFDVTNPPPRMLPLGPAGNRGFQKFQAIGCADCHRPFIDTNYRRVPLAQPEVANDPTANVYATISLTHVGFQAVPGGGVRVPMFADLKRHDMGPGLAETFERGDLRNEEFTTARLWGIADTAPYLHDGRATTLEDAIEMHGGEAQAARDAFVALTPQQRDDLLFFLSRLKTPKHPNEELVSILNN